MTHPPMTHAELATALKALRLGVGASERRTVVTGFLDDILVKLARLPARNSLASFVITSFRNCVADMHRETVARERSLLAEEVVGAEGVVRASCSEYMLRAAEGFSVADGASQSLPEASLVRLLFGGCSTTERQLLVWSAHRVPLRECAAWLGISYDTAKQRLSRLRARLIRESVAHLAALPDSDREELAARLRRAGVGIGTLYRHFPTRDALIEAVYRRELEGFAEAGDRLAATLPPGEALHAWMRLLVDYVASKKVIAAAVATMVSDSNGASAVFTIHL